MIACSCSFNYRNKKVEVLYKAAKLSVYAMKHILAMAFLAKKPRDEFGGKLTALEIKRCEEVLPEDFVRGSAVGICGGRLSNATYEGAKFVPIPTDESAASAGEGTIANVAATAEIADTAVSDTVMPSETDGTKR